jgi:arylsulfatase
MKSPEHFKGLTHHPTLDTPLKVVVILGESARADLMSAYGYERPTTPWLDSISKNGNEVVLFNDVCSSGPNTIMSSQRIFTFWNNTPNKAWYNYPDLTNVLAHAGYYTHWITQQNPQNMYAIERLFANSAHKLYKTHIYTSLYKIKDSSLSVMAYDEALLPALHRYDSPNTTHVNRKNIFTVVHLMGSHQNYSERYPPAFDFFKAKDMKECLTDDAKSQKAAYLNSLRYTDHLLEKMIKHYSSQRALVFYFSDHGEMIDEPQQRGFFGHGTNVDHPTIDIPFFVYASPQLRKEHPEFWERIKKAQFRPISTAWFTNSLTSLLGIRTKYNDERYNFFSDKFANPTRIAVQGDERHEVPPLKRKRVKG